MVIRIRSLALIALVLAVAGGAWGQRSRSSSQATYGEPGSEQPGEFHFVRMIYTDAPGQRRGSSGWWMQDYPDAEDHFNEGVARLTRVDIGESVTVQLTDEHLFEYPWLYATQVGYWELSNAELVQLREYLLRGGFLMTDDFFGTSEWNVFADTMRRLFPDRQLREIPTDDAMLHVVYNIDEVTQIPGLRHLACGGFGGGFSSRGSGTLAGQLPAPEWHGIYDDEGRLMVAVNYNQDVGDAWEEADDPCYPEPMTTLAYRIAINYVMYTMTH
jgi:Domain of unknown function (DUF4159)